MYNEDVELQQLIINDENEGLTKAFELYSGQIKTICRNILSDMTSEDVEEAISDCFVALWKSIAKYDPEKGSSLKSFFYGIARNTALLYRRKKGKNELPIDDTIISDEIDLENDLIVKETEKTVHIAVDEMDEPDRSIFIMRFFYFEKVVNIAERLNIPVKRVENGLFRGKEKLKLKLLERGLVR